MSILLIISNYAIPFVIGYIVLYGLIKRVSVYQIFIDGVNEGFKMVVDVAPTLIGLMVAVGIFRSSGCLSIMCQLLSPLTEIFSIPVEIIPISIIRMFSSSAATGMTLDIYKNFGPDSILGNTVSIMMSSTETIFYTMSVYFLSVGITKTRWTLAGALLSSIAGLIISIILGAAM